MASRTRGSLIGLTAMTVAAATVLTGCASSPSSDSSSGDTLTKVTYSQSTPTLSFAPVLIARDKGFFKDHGIDLDFTTQESGSVATQALLSNSIQFAGLASTDITGAVAKGAKMTSIENMMNMTMEVCVSKKWADSAGVSKTSSVKDRLAALKGANVGITAAGSISDRAMRWLLQDKGGLNPDKDTKIVSVAGASALNAALQSDQIQAYLLSPPNCETAVKAGYGEVLVQPTEMKDFADVVLQVLVANDSYLKGHADIARQFAQAVAEGGDFIREHPTQAAELLQKDFPQTDAAIITNAVTDIIAPQIPKGGMSTESAWSTTGKILDVNGLDGDSLDLSDGGIWTNEYLQ
jgi:NitT/TauT family transport system substrate-binding protein